MSMQSLKLDHASPVTSVRPSRLTGVVRASQLSTGSTLSCPSFLKSGLSQLDEALGGGLVGNDMIEVGCRAGQRARELLTCFLRHEGAAMWTLWVSCSGAWQAYPSAWAARGISLARMRFARTEAPVEDLKPVYSAKVFHTVVLDQPDRLQKGDLAFLKQQCVRHGLRIIILREGCLSSYAGNVWAHTRLNVMASDRHPDQLQVEVLKARKGRSMRACSLTLPTPLLPSFS